MTELAKPTDAEDIAKLLVHYSFDLNGYRPEQLIHHWFTLYPADWVRLAVIEALYQGRYKVVSVEQILAIWQRRQKPIPHFNGEFQRIVSSRLPKTLREQSSSETALESSLSHFEDWPGPERWVRRAEAVAASRDALAKTGQVNDITLTPLPSSSAASTVSGVSEMGVHGSPSSTSSSTNGTNGVHRSLNGSDSDLVVIIDARDERAIAPEPDERLAPTSSALADPTPERGIATPSNGNGKHPPTSSPIYSDAKPVQWSVNYPVRTPSISQFVPAGRASGFYSRLKAVVQRHVFTPPSPADAPAKLSNFHNTDVSLGSDTLPVGQDLNE